MTTAPRASDQNERGRLYVATLRHPGGCNSAPRAVTNLMNAAADQLGVRTHVRERPLAITDDALFDYHLVFMHGRTSFRLTDAERKRLKLYVERGGMILADSICTAGPSPNRSAARWRPSFPTINWNASRPTIRC